MISSGNNRVGEGESQRSRQVPLPICGMYVGNYTTERGEEEKDRPRIRELYVCLLFLGWLRLRPRMRMR